MYANKINGLNYKSYGNLGGSGLTNRPNPSNLGLNSSMSNGARVQKTGWFSDLKPKSDATRTAEQCKYGPKSITTKKSHSASAGGGGRKLISGDAKRTNEIIVICNDPPKTNVRSAPKVKR